MTVRIASLQSFREHTIQGQSPGNSLIDSGESGAARARLLDSHVTPEKTIDKAISRQSAPLDFSRFRPLVANEPRTFIETRVLVSAINLGGVHSMDN